MEETNKARAGNIQGWRWMRQGQGIVRAEESLMALADSRVKREIIDIFAHGRIV